MNKEKTLEVLEEALDRLSTKGQILAYMDDFLSAQETDKEIAKLEWEKFYREYLKQDRIKHFFQFPRWLDKESE